MKTVGGTILGPNGTALPSVQIDIELVLAQGFIISSAASIAQRVTTESNASGVWSLSLIPNDEITPVGTLYLVTEKIPNIYGGLKSYYIQVLSTLPGGVNQVLNLIVNDFAPVGGTYAPIGTGPQGDPGYIGIADRAALDAVNPDVEGRIQWQQDRDIAWLWNGTQYVPVGLPTFTSEAQRDANYTEELSGHGYYLASNDVAEGLYFTTSDPSFRPPWNLPWGRHPGAEGYKQVTASQGSITSIVDLTGLSLNPTLITNRRMRVTLCLANVASTVTTDRVDVSLTDEFNATLRNTNWPVPTAHSVTLIHEFDSVAGAITLKARATRSGTGTATASAAATAASFISLDDIGPSGAPT